MLIYGGSTLRGLDPEIYSLNLKTLVCTILPRTDFAPSARRASLIEVSYPYFYMTMGEANDETEPENIFDVRLYRYSFIE